MNFWDSIVLFGVIQGVTSGVIILRMSRGKKSSNYLMAALLFVLGLTCLNLLVGYLGLHDRYEWVGVINRFFPLLHAILIGPITFLLVKSEVDPMFAFKKTWKHLLLGFWSFIPHTIEVFKAIFSPRGDYGQIIGYFFRYGDAVLWSTITVYLILAKRLLDRGSTTTAVALLRSFVNVFLTFQLIVWLPFLVVYFSPWESLIWEKGIDDYFIYIPLVAMIYWFGIRWMTSSEAKGIMDKRNVLLDADVLSREVMNLKEVMKEKQLYLDSDLSLKSLANRIRIPINQMSYVLNEGLSRNFNEFINEYRVEEVCKKLRDPSFNHLTIAALAISSGFNSIPTFQRTFKQLKGKTPKEYKSEQQDKVFEI